MRPSPDPAYDTDKTAINYGNLYGIKVSQNINTDQFAWYGSVFYLGYLLCAWPAQNVLQRFPVSRRGCRRSLQTGRTMGVVCFFWGITCASMAGVKNFAGGMVNRFILGCLESAVTPGLGLMTPLWWTLREQPSRHLSWYCFNGVASIIGNLTSLCVKPLSAADRSGLGHVVNSAVPTWALIFITFGSFTSLWGIFLFFYLPDSPASARFLKEEQKIIAVRRIAGNRVSTLPFPH